MALATLAPHAFSSWRGCEFYMTDFGRAVLGCGWLHGVPSMMRRGSRHDLPNRLAQDPVDEAPIGMQRGVLQIGMTDRKPRKPGEHAPQAKFSFYDWPDPILPLKDLDPGAR